MAGTPAAERRVAPAHSALRHADADAGANERQLGGVAVDAGDEPLEWDVATVHLQHGEVEPVAIGPDQIMVVKVRDGVGPTAPREVIDMCEEAELDRRHLAGDECPLRRLLHTDGDVRLLLKDIRDKIAQLDLEDEVGVPATQLRHYRR